jgi:hypothetical protein
MVAVVVVLGAAAAVDPSSCLLRSLLPIRIYIYMYIYIYKGGVVPKERESVRSDRICWGPLGENYSKVGIIMMQEYVYIYILFFSLERKGNYQCESHQQHVHEYE